MMGHADIKTTERYAKPDEAAIEQAVRELDEKRRRT
jgi:site-specific recombinase XerD